MTNEPTLSLREVANFLGQIGKRPAKDALPRLLALLRAGKLKAGFEFVASRAVWISIPTVYWTDVNSDKFSSLRIARNNKRKNGVYEVRVGEFVQEYIDALSEQTETRLETADAAINELRITLPKAERRCEVRIASEEWKKYLRQNQISLPGETRGAPQKTSWKRLAPIIAAYMMGLDTAAVRGKHAYHATCILEIASREHISDLPAETTLKGVIADIFKRVDQHKSAS